MNSPALVILAAGRARRYGGVKPLAPIGPNGEAVIDLLGSDAIEAGFSPIVLVLGNETGPQIRHHVETNWPAGIDVRFCIQERPRGTVDAVLAAVESVDEATPFAVANADDLYGLAALKTLRAHLEGSNTSAVVGYRLDQVVLGTAPVTRGVCEDDGTGRLSNVTERKQVTRDGDRFSSSDGLEPSHLDPRSLVSMNLWGFVPEMWTELRKAMEANPSASEEVEALLPDLIASLIARAKGGEESAVTSFAMLACEEACVGVTHPEDLGIVQQAVLDQVAAGIRKSSTFSSVG